MLFPFKKKQTQKLVSVIGIILGILLMISTKTVTIWTLTINSFITGAIIAFLGFFYLIDIL